MTDPSAMARFAFMIAGIVAAAVLGAVIGPGTALAACTDPPAPKVNWQRCAFDGLDLTGVDLSGARLRDGSFFRSDLSGATWIDGKRVCAEGSLGRCN